MKPVLHFRIPLNENNNSIVPIEQLAQFIKTMREMIGEDYTIIASPFIMDTTDSSCKSILLNETTLDKFFEELNKTKGE